MLLTKPSVVLPLNRVVSLVARRAFQTTAVKCLTIPFIPTVPQKPGGVIGTANDPYVHPKPNKMEGSVHWWLEKAFAVTTIPMATAAMFMTGPYSIAADSVFSTALLGYCYMEFHSCITDYIPARIYGRWHNYALYLLGAGSLVSLAGIYKMETEYDGLTGLVKSMWTGKPVEKQEKK